MRHAALCSALLAGALALTPLHALAADLTPVPSANPKALGVVAPSVLSPELAEIVRAQGAMKLENPAGIVTHYGYVSDRPNMMPPLGSNQEATKTEPDKNTYLRLRGQHGADPRDDYGTNFLFQGHENSAPAAAGGPKVGYITRINLDADVAHRVTLMAATDVSGAPLPVFDGSTWYPWAQRLLFTFEAGNRGGVWQATLDVPSVVEDISGAFGRGGYEGIQADSEGNLWIVEDVGGPTGAVNRNARQPNSFIYRFVPKNVRDLRDGGRLQVLAVQSLAHPGTIVFNNPIPDVDILSQDVLDLHTYGKALKTSWVTIHDTATDGNAPFDANARAKGKGTPFKRPENGVFRPGTRFGEFYFTETGDTNANTEAKLLVGNGSYGGFGGLFKLAQRHPSDDDGVLTLFFLGDLQHTGFDNIQFWSKDTLVAVEDRGDTLHTQGNALDSGYMFDVRLDYGNPANPPLRFLAQGRDPSATIDSPLLGTPGFQNDGDNEITGFHVSDGDASIGGILGAKNPRPFEDGWRVFYTGQHGDNVTHEIIPNPNTPRGEQGCDRDDDD
jgi:hypothetical protein